MTPAIPRVPPVSSRRVGMTPMASAIKIAWRRPRRQRVDEDRRGPNRLPTWNHRLGAVLVDAVTRLLSDLVAIPSVNPMGRALRGPGFLEGGMSDYLERWFRALGVPYERRTVSPGRENVIARYEAPGARKTVLFDAHQDTVPTDGMTIPPFQPEVREGRLYGRGSCDVKGGMAAMLTAFERLVRERPRASASVTMACTVDEEFTHTGASQLAASGPGADYAIVAEP